MNAARRRTVWREPMLWLVAGLPLLVLVAAGVTVGLASRAPADAAAAQVRRIAQVQVEDLALDREAARRGLEAALEVSAAAGAITLSANGAGFAEDRLELRMLHPLHASQDRTVVLVRSGDAWHGDTTTWTPQAWELRLQPPQGRWRLTGRLPRDAVRTSMLPAVAP
jgi:uncharacterized protein